jgi:hypothetical protein
VNDLFTDLSDGKVLIKLLETISGEKIGAPGNIYNAGFIYLKKSSMLSVCTRGPFAVLKPCA